MERVNYRREKFEKRTDLNLIRKSEETLLRKRKSMLEDYFLKKRISNIRIDYGISLDSLNLDEHKKEHIKEMFKNVENVKNPLIYSGLLSENPNTIRLSLFLLSNFLNYSIEERQSFKDFASENIVDKLCDLCCVDDKAVQYESSVILINLTCIEEEVSQRLLNFPENLEKIKSLTLEKDFILIEHFIRIFYNMSMDTIYYINDILKTGIISNCICFLKLPDIPQTLIIEINKLIQKLFKEFNPIDLVKEIILINSKLLIDSNDEDVSFYIIKTFVVFKIDEAIITCLIDAGVTKKLLILCQSDNFLLKKLSLVLVGNMLSENDIHSFIFIQFGVLKTFYFLLDENKDEVLESTILGISNLCNRVEITKQIIEMGIFQKIILIFSKLIRKENNTKSEIAVLKECIYCIGNAVIDTLDNIKYYFLDLEHTDVILGLMLCLELFNNLKDHSIVFIILEILNSFLDIDESLYNPKIKTIMLSYNLDKMIDILIHSKNTKIEQICSMLSEKLEDD